LNWPSSHNTRSAYELRYEWNFPALLDYHKYIDTARASWRGPFSFEEGKMADFRGKRVTHHYVQTNISSPETVFPLLCPVAEAKWVPGWQYRLIYSQSGLVELGCVFTTHNEDGTESTWVTTEYDPAKFCVGFVWVNPGLMAAQIQIELYPKQEAKTEARIRYSYTGLSQEGNRELERYTEAWFREKMEGWEAAINHYLQTGRLIGAAPLE
jgi:hypothetical protein